MKRWLIITLLFLVIACNQQQTPAEKPADVVAYDSTLAKELGADKYGMKKYIFAFLKRGPNRPTDPKKSAELQRAHLDNINRLAIEGKLVLAGPFMDNDDVRGIYIFNVETLEEARKLVETDPAIQAGSLEMELKEWYGSAALQLLLELYPKVTKEKV